MVSEASPGPSCKPINYASAKRRSTRFYEEASPAASRQAAGTSGGRLRSALFQSRSQDGTLRRNLRGTCWANRPSGREGGSEGSFDTPFQIEYFGGSFSAGIFCEIN